jgi:transposase
MTKDIFYKIEVLEQHLSGKITVVKLAEKLNLSKRQTQRVINRYRNSGRLSLIHKLSNKSSNHSLDKDLKEKVLKLAKEKYFDFGPTLMSECLKKRDNIIINIFTLRLWLKENKLINKLRKRKSYRTKRERKKYFGDMLQIDGSFHEWFTSQNIVNKEDKKACLLNLIDDNTNIIELMFDKQETTKCASLLLWKWIQKYGIPQSIYCDRRNMYITEKDKNKEKTELHNPKGFFRTMCNNLNITVIEANSPQAKGRVERGNKTHQDRLIKLMRLKNITNIEETNKYLDEEYIKEHNEKFALQIMNMNNKINNTDNIVDIHRKLEDNITLDDICYIEEIRKLRNDWTVSFKGNWYQLKKESQYNIPSKSTVYVKMYIDETIGIFYGNHPIKYEEIR